MADRIDIKMADLPGFQHAMQAAPQTLNAEMLTAAKRIGARGHALSGAYVPHGWTGNLAGSIYGRGESYSGGVQAIFGASADYALTVDRGRKPGSKMPPAGVLLYGMQRLGIPASAEYAVRRKIARDGIPAKPFVTRAHKEMSVGFYLKEFSGAVARTIKRIIGR